MSKNKIYSLVTLIINSVIIITLVSIIIMYFIGNYSFNQLLEDIFFISLTVCCILFLPRLERYYKIIFPLNVKVLMYLFIFGLFIVGNVYNLFMNTIWFDKLLHLTSGYFLASIGLLFANKWLSHSRVVVKSYIAFMYSLSIVLLWEVFEFIGDILISIVLPSYEYAMQFYHIEREVWILPQPYPLVDTMLDVILGVIGALIFVIYYIKKSNRNEVHNK